MAWPGHMCTVKIYGILQVILWYTVMAFRKILFREFVKKTYSHAFCWVLVN